MAALTISIEKYTETLTFMSISLCMCTAGIMIGIVHSVRTAIIPIIGLTLGRGSTTLGMDTTMEGTIIISGLILGMSIQRSGWWITIGLRC